MTIAEHKAQSAKTFEKGFLGFCSKALRASNRKQLTTKFCFYQFYQAVEVLEVSWGNVRRF